MKWQEIKPVPKVERPAFAGAIVVVGVWGVETFSAVAVPATISAALVVIVAGVVGWLAPPRG